MGVALGVAQTLAGCGNRADPAGRSGARTVPVSAADAAGRARLDEIGAALRARADAYRRADRAAWCAAVRVGADPSAPREDGAAYDVLRGMGVGQVAYGEPRLLDDGAVGCELEHAVAGFDTTPAAATTRWDRGDLPPVRCDRPVFAWEEPGAVARRGDAAVAVAVGGDAATDVWRHATEAVGVVRRRCAIADLRAVVVMPAGLETFGRWSAAAGGVGEIPAVTVGPVREGRATGCDRIVLNPRLWADLGPPGRRVVLSHEVAHLFLRRSGAGARPAWLDEGFCEYLAYADAQLEERVIVAPLLRQVRRRGLPRRLPDQLPPADAPDPDDPAAVYAAGLVACRAIAAHAGEAALVRLAVTAHDVRSSAAAVSGPLREATGWTLSDLEHAWTARLRALAEAP